MNLVPGWQRTKIRLEWIKVTDHCTYLTETFLSLELIPQQSTLLVLQFQLLFKDDNFTRFLHCMCAAVSKPLHLPIFLFQNELIVRMFWQWLRLGFRWFGAGWRFGFRFYLKVNTLFNLPKRDYKTQHFWPGYFDEHSLWSETKLWLIKSNKSSVIDLELFEFLPPQCLIWNQMKQGNSQGNHQSTG